MHTPKIISLIPTQAVPETMPSLPATWPKNAPYSFHVLGKPSGATCNLDCTYCFFLSKEKLYPNGRFRMSDETLETHIRQLLESQNEAWCDFFREHHFLIGLSLDGPQVMHDTYRVDKGGAPTFHKVMWAALLLQEHQVEFNILTTVNAANADRPLEVYRFLRDEVGTQFIQFIPIVERINAQGEIGFQEGNQVSERSVKSEQWGTFLITIFDEWVRRDVGTVFVQMFDAALASWYGAPPALCIFSETCGKALALEHNGDLYSCDHFVEPKYLLGNIKNKHMIDLVASDKQRQFGLHKRDSLPRYCRECEVRFACHGECPKNRFIETPDGEPGLNYLCAGYKAFFTHVDKPMRMMAELLRRNRAPAEVMLVLAAEEKQLQKAFAKAGRNEPCPCGSGRKFKQCHGR